MERRKERNNLTCVSAESEGARHEADEMVHLAIVVLAIPVGQEGQARLLRGEEELLHHSIDGPVVHVPQPPLFLAALQPHLQQVLVEGVSESSERDLKRRSVINGVQEETCHGTCESAKCPLSMPILIG